MVLPGIVKYWSGAFPLSTPCASQPTAIDWSEER